MRRRLKTNRGGHETGNLWISFSDLMSALMLIFVLILFYAVYQYYDMLEVKTAELLRQSGILDQQAAQLSESEAALKEKEAALNEAQTALDKKETELNDQSEKLTATETKLLAEQAKLVLQQQTLDELQAKLDEQEEALGKAQVSLDEALLAQQEQEAKLIAQQTQLNVQQAQMEAQQTQLDTQKQQMESQQQQMEAQQQQLDKLVGVRSAIVEELMRALADSNINDASVDESGAIVFSSEMMFDVNKSTLKDVGKQFLNSFIPRYLQVLMSDQYRQYVSQIIIEGHTDTDGTFLNNMRLSQDRAYAVLSYILSREFTGISSAAKQQLQDIVTVNGRSYSDPILKADGSVDMAASRRVVIKFRMNDEEMVNQMLSILEGME